MNIEQAKLLVKGALHVRNVGAMRAMGTDWFMKGTPVCFVCEMRRANLVEPEQVGASCSVFEPNSFDKYFGIKKIDGIAITTGNYKNGPECYEAVKALLVKYNFGHLLEPEEIIPVRQPVYKDQFTPADPSGFDWRKIGVTC